MRNPPRASNFRAFVQVIACAILRQSISRHISGFVLWIVQPRGPRYTQSPFAAWASISAPGMYGCGSVWYWLGSSLGSSRTASLWQQRVQPPHGTSYRRSNPAVEPTAKSYAFVIGSPLR